MKILITICGRAGSKGAKGKNVRLLKGRPLIYYTLKRAVQFRDADSESRDVDIVISSDGQHILDCGKEFDYIYTYKRPQNFAEDTTPKVPVIQQVTRFMEEKLNKIYDFVIDLDITSPLRNLEDIEGALKKCSDTEYNYDLVFSAVESRRNPYFNMVEIHDGIAEKVKDSDYVCRQQAPDVYDMNASIYCYRRDSLINKLKRITFEGISGMYLMKDTYVIDIDRESDFEVLQILVDNYFGSRYEGLF